VADNVNVSNAPASSNPDIPVRTSETAAGKQIQHMRLDLGSGTTESVVSGTVPVSGTVTVSEPVSVDDNGASLTVDATSWPLPTGAATAALQLPDGHNVTVDNAAGAAAVNIQDGGNSITVDAASLPLPTGAATEATLSTLNGKVTACDTGNVTIAALPNEGQQTMANSISVAIASNQSVIPVSDNSTTLSVDDGAGSLTVDGTVAATQSGTWNITNVSGTVSLPTGAATSANQTTEITALQLIDDIVLAEDAVHSSGAAGVLALTRRADTASTSAGTDGDYATLNTNGDGRLHVADTRTGGSAQQIQGNIAAGAAVSGTNPVTIAFKDIFGNAAIPTGIDAGGINVLGTWSLDGSLNLADISPSGETYVTSLVAHDAVDSGNPIKVGGYAVTNNDGLTACASADRSDLSTDRRKRLIIDSDRILTASATFAVTTNTQIIAAPGAGSKIQVYGIHASLHTPDSSSLGAGADESEGIRFRFASGTWHFHRIWKTSQFNSIDGKDLGLCVSPDSIVIQPGHWDGGDNEALNGALVGLSTVGTYTAYVTVTYRVMPT